MKSFELEAPVYVIERKPELAFAEVEEVDLSDFHSYSIVHIESGIGYGEDQYGWYKTVSEEYISIQLFESREERGDYMIGMAENRDDSFDFETIASGSLKRF